ncbi:MAG: diacylglycerol kinase family lipid kinase [Clostridia bacterium]|nr:diacylglycerol kinase family lipid kinase [Clostridia bacterium]
MTDQTTNARKRCLIIVNPCAGRKKGLRSLPKLHRFFDENGYSVTDHVTASRGDGRAIAEAAEGFDMILCVGGDGTLNEVITGVLRSGKNTPVGYIPAGSTNDFARSLGIPYKPMKAAKQIVSEPPMKLDIGYYGDRYFTYVASFGIFTRTSYSAPQKLKNAIGHLAYILHGIREVVHVHPVEAEVETEDGRVSRERFIFGSFSNSTSFGGVLRLNPADVDFSDGAFEVMLIRPPKTPRQLSRCLRALRKGKPYDSDEISFFRTSKVVMRFPSSDAPFSLDGEYAEGKREIEIGVLRQPVTMLGCRPKRAPAGDPTPEPAKTLCL